MPKAEQARVIYNASAGNAGNIGVEAVADCLREQGYAADIRITTSESELDDILPDCRGLVVVCGGDGTFSSVVRRVAGRRDVEVAFLPVGTANNVAHSLELPPGSLDAIRDLRSRPRRELDIGAVTFGDERENFVEGFGCGVYAEVLHVYDPGLGKSVMRALESLVDVLQNFDPVYVRGSVDGEDVSGEYLAFAALNMKRVGPRMELAPQADPFDGALDVVGLQPNVRPAMLDYVGALTGNSIGDLRNGSHWRGRHVKIAPAGLRFHLDTVTYGLAARAQASDGEDDMLSIEVSPDTAIVVAASD